MDQPNPRQAEIASCPDDPVGHCCPVLHCAWSVRTEGFQHIHQAQKMPIEGLQRVGKRKTHHRARSYDPCTKSQMFTEQARLTRGTSVAPTAAVAHGLPSVRYPHSFMTLAHRDQRNTNQSPKPRAEHIQLLQLACSYRRPSRTVYPHLHFSPLSRIYSPVWAKGRRKLRKNDQLPKSATDRRERGKPHVQIHQRIIEESCRYAKAHDWGNCRYR
jgi:hypothetical protein